MIVRVFTDDGEDREFHVEKPVTEVIVYTEALVPLGKLDLRPAAPSQPKRHTGADHDRCR